jgi:hypothetical protein
MKIKQSAILAALAAGAAISTQEAGFLPGMIVAAIIGSPSGTFSGTAQLQTSQDGTTWSNAVGSSPVTSGGVNIQPVVLAQFIRLNVSAYTSGNLQATFLSDID